MSNMLMFGQSSSNTKLEDDILADLGSKKALGKPIILNEVVSLLNPDSNNKKIKNWMINEKICNKVEWNKSIHYQTVKNLLGNYPKNATEYLQLWIKRKNIILDYILN